MLSVDIMKKITIYGTIAILLIASITITLGSNVKADDEGTYDIYVDDDANSSWYNPTHVRTIQEGIDNASSGDIVYVFNGTYAENVVINKSITLIGENKNNTIIVCGGNGNGINVSADNIYITGFMIGNNGSMALGFGIELNSIQHCFIENNIIKDCGSGIAIVASSNNTIINNNISNTGGGIGIQIVSCNSSTISDNNIKNNWCGILGDVSNNNTINDNNISGCIGGIWLHTSSNNMIVKNAIKKNLQSINLGSYSNNNSIINNKISSNWYGLYMWSCNNNIVIKNDINGNTHGIELDDTHDNIFYYNNFINNEWDAYEEDSNIWYNTILSEGNYWDEYNGEDSDSNGIGDTPCDITGGDNKDPYPLMKPYQIPKIDIELKKFSLSRVALKITNTGDIGVSNIDCFISVKGGFFNKIDIAKTGQIETLKSKKSERASTWGINSRMVRGFGPVDITVNVSIYGVTLEKHYHGFVIGRLFIDTIDRL